jgi:hypothetical protein
MLASIFCKAVVRLTTETAAMFGVFCKDIAGVPSFAPSSLLLTINHHIKGEKLASC